MKSKKALGTLQSIIITLMIIGIVLGIGFLVLEEFEVTLSDTTGTVENETLTGITDAGVYVINNHTTSELYCYHSFAPSLVTNASDGLTITSTNYSYEAATGRFWNLSSYGAGAGILTWNITYTYQYGDSEACEGVGETITAMATIPTWLAIIVILLIVGILLAIVFKAMPRAGEGGGGIGFEGGGASPVTAEI